MYIECCGEIGMGNAAFGCLANNDNTYLYDATMMFSELY